jgi:hypothetical protein
MSIFILAYITRHTICRILSLALARMPACLSARPLDRAPPSDFPLSLSDCLSSFSFFQLSSSFDYLPYLRSSAILSLYSSIMPDSSPSHFLLTPSYTYVTCPMCSCPHLLSYPFQFLLIVLYLICMCKFKGFCVYLAPSHRPSASSSPLASRYCPLIY